MISLRELLQKADNEGWAIPHFNFANLEMLKAIVKSAKELSSPVIVGTSEGEGKFIGLSQAFSLVESYKKELPIFLNADHTHSVEKAKKAIDAGYDSVLIDLSEEEFEKNKKGTKEVADYARTKNRDIVIEGELGYLPGSSEILSEKVEIKEGDFTKPEEAREFIEKTGIDMLAPAIGNIHGVKAKNLPNPGLNLDRLRELDKATSAFFVLHGGSGTPEEDLKNSIPAGINIIHVNTEVRIAYADSLRKSLANNPDQTTPYKIFPPVIEAMKEVLKRKIDVYGSGGKAVD